MMILMVTPTRRAKSHPKLASRVGKDVGNDHCKYGFPSAHHGSTTSAIYVSISRVELVVTGWDSRGLDPNPTAHVLYSEVEWNRYGRLCFGKTHLSSSTGLHYDSCTIPCCNHTRDGPDNFAAVQSQSLWRGSNI